MKAPVLAAAALALLALAGCETADVDRGSPAFQAGHADGCRTAGLRGSGISGAAVRDEARWAADAAYKEGWRFGYNDCGGARPSPGADTYGGRRD